MGKRVLIVDDSSMIHSLMREALEANGHEVCGDASNGRDGFELYKELKPDVVFLDITMPILDGVGALKEIIAFDSSAKVVMLTAMGDEEIMKEVLEIGAKVFLKKPFSEYKVMSALSQIE